MLKSTRTNVLIIHADQHRTDCIGAYGNRDVCTPNIDRIAKDGVLYKNCFSTYPVCTPSRYSLLTGLYVHQHMGWSNCSTLPEAIEKLPEILKRAGYRTKAIGKMHFTPTYLDVGFEEMELAEQHGPGRYDDDYHRYLMNNDKVDETDLQDQVKEYRERAPREYFESFGAVKSNLEDNYYSTTWIGNKAQEEIENWGDGGNLLMVGFIKPHHPFDPPPPWCSMYNPKELDLLPGWTEEAFLYDIEKRRKAFFDSEKLTEDSYRKILAYYYGSISQIDYQVGNMIEILKEKGLYDKTLIIYTSDHGDYMGYHHMVGKQKYMYDPVIRVPLIIKYPDQEDCGKISEELFSIIDIAPTILSQTGCTPGIHMKGLDIGTGKGREVVFAENDQGREYMVRSSTRKLLLCKERNKSLFFDMEKDPLEMNNLFNCPHYREEIEEYISILNNWILFQSLTPLYLDESARIIDKENVLPQDGGHRQRVMEYFKNKMQKEDL